MCLHRLIKRTVCSGTEYKICACVISLSLYDASDSRWRFARTRRREGRRREIEREKEKENAHHTILLEKSRQDFTRRRRGAPAKTSLPYLRHDYDAGNNDILPRLGR